MNVGAHGAPGIEVISNRRAKSLAWRRRLHCGNDSSGARGRHNDDSEISRKRYFGHVGIVVGYGFGAGHSQAGSFESLRFVVLRRYGALLCSKNLARAELRIIDGLRRYAAFGSPQIDTAD